MISLCPPMYLVALSSTMSKPRSAGLQAAHLKCSAPELWRAQRDNAVPRCGHVLSSVGLLSHVLCLGAFRLQCAQAPTLCTTRILKTTWRMCKVTHSHVVHGYASLLWLRFMQLLHLEYLSRVESQFCKVMISIQPVGRHQHVHSESRQKRQVHAPE